jgi:hypothetical protein
LSKKKKSDTEAEKIKNRVKEMVKERPSHKEVLEFYKDVVVEQNSALLKIKTSPIIIDKDNAKEKIEQGFFLVEKKAFILTALQLQDCSDVCAKSFRTYIKCVTNQKEIQIEKIACLKY